MTNSELLKQKIRDSGLKLDFIRERLNISYAWLKKKIDGEVEFKASEISGMCDVLRITDPDEMKSIFFGVDVEKSSTMGE